MWLTHSRAGPPILKLKLHDSGCLVDQTLFQMGGGKGKFQNGEKTRRTLVCLPLKCALIWFCCTCLITTITVKGANCKVRTGLQPGVHQTLASRITKIALHNSLHVQQGRSWNVDRTKVGQRPAPTSCCSCKVEHIIATDLCLAQ